MKEKCPLILLFLWIFFFAQKKVRISFPHKQPSALAKYESCHLFIPSICFQHNE